MNKMSQSISKLKSLPFGNFFVNLALKTTIPYLMTSKIKILEISENRVVVQLRNDRKIRNHIGQVHAAAMILVAETATGLLVGMNTPDSSMPLIKEMNTKFVKRSKGTITAVAELSADQKSAFQNEKSELLISVKVTDEVDVEPIVVLANWAWTPKKRPQA